MSAPTLLVMAAGIGSRYGGLKQIDPVGPSGEIILDYSVYDALAAGFRKIVFIIRPEIEAAFREKLGDRIASRTQCVYVHQRLEDLPPGRTVPPGRQKPWGTGHAVLRCLEAVGEPFGVINADDFYGADAFRTLGRYLARARDQAGRLDVCMVGYSLGNTVSPHGHVARGICQTTSDGYLTQITERTRIEVHEGRIEYLDPNGSWVGLPPETTVSMNMWGFTPGFFGELQPRFEKFLREEAADPKAEYFLPSVVGQLLAERKAAARVLPTTARWVGVTYKEDIPRVREAIAGLVRQGAYPAALWGA